jgi:hypothetical protein
MILARRLLAVLTLIALSAILVHWYRPSRSSGPIPQQAYIWNRAWTSAVQESIRTSAPNFDGYAALAAEVSFRADRLDIARVALDYASLRNANIPIGLALRIGPFSGRFSPDDATAVRITDLAATLIGDAKANGLQPAELQIDFDCPDSKLEGYRIWVQAITRRIAPVPVTITALPSWLSDPAFAPLAKAADGYVLQVHSLQRPTSIDASMTLCDVPAVRRWVEQAGRIGVPFRVALPTYAYLIAFDENGIFKGLSAEGPSLDWPAGATVRTLCADPAAMADLVGGWSADRPRCMTGLIWYRLPVSGNALNWRWTTLQSVMSGRAPHADLRAAVRRSEPGLFEVELTNDGKADAPLASVTVRWNRASLVAADALGGFEQVEHDNFLIFRPSPALAIERLAPGDRRAIAWLRLSEDKEVQAYVGNPNP